MAFLLDSLGARHLRRRFGSEDGHSDAVVSFLGRYGSARVQLASAGEGPCCLSLLGIEDVACLVAVVHVGGQLVHSAVVGLVDVA
jgi:hypothetical protein